MGYLWDVKLDIYGIFMGYLWDIYGFPNYDMFGYPWVSYFQTHSKKQTRE
jgi:hypothetical protein